MGFKVFKLDNEDNKFKGEVKMNKFNVYLLDEHDYVAANNETEAINMLYDITGVLVDIDDVEEVDVTKKKMAFPIKELPDSFLLSKTHNNQEIYLMLMKSIELFKSFNILWSLKTPLNHTITEWEDEVCIMLEFEHVLMIEAKDKPYIVASTEC